MTTIACDGKSMAGDGKTTINGTITSLSMRKIFKLKDGRVIGGCGPIESLFVVMRWLENGGDKPKVDQDFSALLMSHDGVKCCSDTLEWLAMDTPMAIGSGMQVALGAMDSGICPAQAVNVASKRDVYTGGVITVEYLE